MGRPPNTDERRAQIVAALSRVMAKHGYEGATIARIAREAGLGAGLVHYHFASKGEVLRALVTGLAARAWARIDSRVARAASPAARVDAALDALLSRGDDEDRDAVACWTLIGAEAIQDAEVRALYGRFLEDLTARLGALVVDACHAEGRSGEGARAIAGALVAQVLGYFALAAAAPTAVPVGSASSMARRAARGLLSAQPLRGAA